MRGADRPVVLAEVHDGNPRVVPTTFDHTSIARPHAAARVTTPIKTGHVGVRVRRGQILPGGTTATIISHPAFASRELAAAQVSESERICRPRSFLLQRTIDSLDRRGSLDCGEPEAGRAA